MSIIYSTWSDPSAVLTVCVSDVGPQHGTFGSGQDLEAARNLLELSAQSNSPSALASLGDVYLFGLGVEKDYVKAYKLLDRAAKLGNAHADVR